MRNSVISAARVVEQAARPTLRAVDYLRVSTEDQKKGFGIAYTGKKTKRHIEKKGWEYVTTFADEGYSGSLDHTERPDLKDLMAMAKQTPRPFDVVVVPEERAIGRRDRAFWPWVWDLEDLGIFVAIVRGDYDNTTEDGRSRMRKEADRAEDERRTIRDRTQGGIQEKGEMGGHPGGVCPYGYRIEDKGVKGESRLVLDEGEKHEAVPVLRQAWVYLTQKGMNPGEVESLFNADGIPGPALDYWPRGSLRHVLTGRAVQESRHVHRDPNGRKTKLDEDGNPVYGDTIIIDLDPIFDPLELELLNKALERTAMGPRLNGEATHPLSKHLVGLCGAYYTGVSRTGRLAEAAYRCTGKVRKNGKSQKCECAQINAEALENRVWSEVCELLSDPERLEAMADEWVQAAKANEVDYAARIIALDEQIADQDATISVTMTAAARQAARKKLDKKAAAEFVDNAVRPLNEELDRLEKLRDVAIEWQKDTEASVNRARDLRVLSKMASRRLHLMNAREQAEVMHLLDVRVTILGEIPRRTRSDDQISAWFRDRDRVVPTLTDAVWTLAEPIVTPVRGRRAKNPRALLEAMLTKARTGCPWRDLSYGSVNTIFQRWVKNGTWEALMAALSEAPGVGVPEPVTLPPLRVEGRVDPRLLIRTDETPGEDDSFKASDYKISPFELESALLEHEAVAEAAVVPAPDEVRLAIPKAYVVLAAGWAPDGETAKAIFAHSRAVLAPYKRIRRLEFAELPKTVSGKIRRIELRERTMHDGSAEFHEEDYR